MLLGLIFRRNSLADSAFEWPLRSRCAPRYTDQTGPRVRRVSGLHHPRPRLPAVAMQWLQGGATGGLLLSPKGTSFGAQRCGICPSCGTRRMAEAAAYLVDHGVLSFPIPLRSLFAVHPELLAPILQIIHRAIATFLIDQTGYPSAIRPPPVLLRSSSASARPPT